MSLEEIRRLVHGFSSLGFQKVRITGGEPTLRKDILEIIETISSQKNIKNIALTTNAFRLRSLLPDLKKAGLSALNISLDSLKNESFAKITGSPLFHQIIDCIDDALVIGFTKIKVNVVLLKGLNDSEVGAFLNYAKNRQISIRFIELMKTGDNLDFFADRHLSTGVVREELFRRGWESIERGLQDGPADVFVHPEFQGSIGLIAPYSNDFCHSCNRLRVSARGKLRLCLFGDGDLDLRPWLQSDEQMRDLPNVIKELMVNKKISHQLQKGIYGTTANFAEIGG
jgi:cyclic pyranopterin phosphate synthase